MAAIAVCVASVAPVHAAEIKVGVFDEVVLEGNIEAGDFDKLRNCVKENQTKSIYLASPGGNVAEAIKIGRLVRASEILRRSPAVASVARRLSGGRRGSAQLLFDTTGCGFFILRD